MHVYSAVGVITLVVALAPLPLSRHCHVAMPRARSISDLGGRRGVAGQRLREGCNSVISRSVPEGEGPVLSRLKAAKMTPAQIPEAQRMAREWKPR